MKEQPSNNINKESSSNIVIIIKEQSLEIRYKFLRVKHSIVDSNFIIKVKCIRDPTMF